MLGYGVWDCARICELAPSATASTELANPIILNVLRAITFPFRRGFLGRSGYYDAAIPPARVASIIPTSMYVMATSVNAGRLRGFIAGETVSCRDGDLTSGHKIAQIGRFRAIWFRVIIVTGVHARKTSRARTKEASIRGLPLASRLVLGVATRGGRSLFFGQRRKVYLIKANNLNSQQLAFASTVNIASGDTSEICGDHRSPEKSAIQLAATASIAKAAKDARLPYEREVCRA
jgi:hypothetical protein